MKQVILFLLSFIWVGSGISMANSTPDSISRWLIVVEEEVKATQDLLDQKLKDLQQEYEQVEAELLLNPHSSDLLLKQLIIKDKMAEAYSAYQFEVTVRRYKKGIELIRILHEKILGLDYHFSSMKAFQNITQLGNPNAYDEFTDVRRILSKQLKKDQAVRLPGILESNPFVSVSYLLVGAVVGDGDKKDREKELDRIACILDFTLEMNQEFSTIYYETEFLRNANSGLLEDCYALFDDYTKPINYIVPLKECRENDDWDQVFGSLSNLTTEMQALQTGTLQMEYLQMLADLEFAIDRLLGFIDNYNRFIQMGERYYQKFELIASNYSNGPACQQEIPVEFQQLQGDIRHSIEKFNQAYNISELKGSQLKNLLYGVF